MLDSNFDRVVSPMALRAVEADRSKEKVGKLESQFPNLGIRDLESDRPIGIGHGLDVIGKETGEAHIVAVVLRVADKHIIDRVSEHIAQDVHDIGVVQDTIPAASDVAGDLALRLLAIVVDLLHSVPKEIVAGSLLTFAQSISR